MKNQLFNHPPFPFSPSDFWAHQRHTKCARNDTWQHKKCHTKAARLVNIGYFIINTNCGWLNFHRGVLSCQRQTSYLAYLPTYTLPPTHPQLSSSLCRGSWKTKIFCDRKSLIYFSWWAQRTKSLRRDSLSVRRRIRLATHECKHVGEKKGMQKQKLHIRRKRETQHHMIPLDRDSRLTYSHYTLFVSFTWILHGVGSFIRKWFAMGKRSERREKFKYGGGALLKGVDVSERWMSFFVCDGCDMIILLTPSVLRVSREKRLCLLVVVACTFLK